MVRQIVSDEPFRGIIEYKYNPSYRGWYEDDGTPHEGVDFNEVLRIVVGPYDKLGHAKSYTKDRLRDYAANTAYEILEVRYERVKEWEITGYEFTIP